MFSYFLLVSMAFAACDKVTTHIEWREMSQTNQRSYLQAVRCLQRKPSKIQAQTGDTQPVTRYADFVYSHSKAISIAHNTAQFLPWHRYFLTVYDQAIRNECNYLGPFPFWDWSIDSEAPERSEIWNSFGKQNGCVTIPGFSPRNATFPNNHCIQRQSNLQGTGSFFSPEQMGLIQSETSYRNFKRELENGPHNLIHSMIGGDMGSVLLSPNDPIFYLHHRNIDRHWAKWQKNNPAPTMAEIFIFSNTENNDNIPNLSDTMRMFGLAADVAVREAIDTKSGNLNGMFCFRYSNSIKPNESQFSKRNLIKRQLKDPTTPPSNDRSHKFNIRVPSTISDEFLNEWKVSPEDVLQLRQTEAEIKKFTEFFNQFPLVFPSSLNQLSKGQSSGWRSKTDQEEASDDKQIQTLVSAFKAKKQ